MEYVQTKEEVANLKTELEGETGRYGSHGAGDEFTTGKFRINFNQMRAQMQILTASLQVRRQRQMQSSKNAGRAANSSE